MNRIALLFSIGLILISASENGFCQRTDSKPKKREIQRNAPSPQPVFDKIEEGISAGDPSFFSSFLSSQTYLSLSYGAPGYYSSNQSFYILQDYFNVYRPNYFKFTNSNTRSDSPYASGFMKYEARGMRGSAQVYVSLKYSGENWIISQITIN